MIVFIFYSTLVFLTYSLINTIYFKRYKTVMRTSGVGGGGGGGKAETPSAQPLPPPAPAAPPPTEDTEVVRQKAEQERKRAAAAKGYGSTDITQGIFANGDMDVKKPTLLGGGQ